jgi:N-dimethylarginine dimethylaminohydrolase
MTIGYRNTFGKAAYGGEGWRYRERSHAEEIGNLWARCGQDSEWAPLEAVLLHRPGPELTAANDPDTALQLELPDLPAAQSEHRKMAEAYRGAGIKVCELAPSGVVSANQMFCADLMFMTREGVVLARPAAAQRAGEERWVAARLAELGIPILRTLTGTATFEGADAMWLDRKTVILGRGLRTNQQGIEQVSAVLAEQGVNTIAVDMPYGAMHLMGMLRIADRNLAICWPRRTPHAAVAALRERGFEVAFIPDEIEAQRGRALNFVTLGPRRILMVEGCPEAEALYKGLGIKCITTPAFELAKAAGAVGCLTAVLRRQSVR